MNPKRFLLIWFIALLAIAAGWTALFWLHLGVSTAGTKEFAELIALKRQRAEAIAGPKVVFLGGSNVWYGLHAETVERLLGVPTVNFGLNIGFGPKYLFRLVKPLLHPGDTVVLSLESEEYYDRDVWEMATYAMGEDVGYFREQPLRLKARWLPGCSWAEIRAALRARLHSVTGDEAAALVRQSNAWGDKTDNQAARETPKMRAQLLAYRVPDHHRAVPDSSDGWQLIRDFHAWCLANGVVLVVSYPPSPADAPAGCERDRWFSRMTAFYEREGITQLDTPWEHLHPRSELYASAYHLNWENAEKRSAVVAGELAGMGIGKNGKHR